MNMLKLSSTSALVLLWAGQDSYKTKMAKDFLNRLDLEAGRSLYEQCEKICSYYDEVIKNRKFGVFDIIEKSISNKNKIFQVVIPGAGLDPLGIEVTEVYPNSIVFEIDSENMEIKSSLYKNLGNKSKPNISFIEADLLNSSSIHSKLCAHGWDPVLPTLLIFEGISYYLPVESIQKLVQLIVPDWMIFEFLKQDKEIAADRVEIPKKVFGIVSSSCDLSYINKYSYPKLEMMFDNMSIADKYSMEHLEKMRTGANKYFLTEDSGWIDVCLLINKKMDDLCSTNHSGRHSLCCGLCFFVQFNQFIACTSSTTI